ncbi:MAG: Yip1 family protein [Pseudomonadales bacterium]
MLGTIIGLLTQPKVAWGKLAEKSDAQLRPYLILPVILGLIPTIAWNYGTTQIGWSIGDSDPTKLAEESARFIAVIYYFTQLAAVYCMGYFIHWMAETYEAESTPLKGFAVAACVVTPALLISVVGVYPNFALDFLIGLLVVSYTVYLLYTGIPIMMKVPAERGFLYASAIVAIGLVVIVIMMVGTVIIWDVGFAPAFVD